jgi:hypothetical protein
VADDHGAGVRQEGVELDEGTTITGTETLRFVSATTQLAPFATASRAKVAPWRVAPGIAKKSVPVLAAARVVLNARDLEAARHHVE